jgi:hypothetical protein
VDNDKSAWTVIFGGPPSRRLGVCVLDRSTVCFMSANVTEIMGVLGIFNPF